MQPAEARVIKDCEVTRAATASRQLASSWPTQFNSGPRPCTLVPSPQPLGPPTPLAFPPPLASFLLLSTQCTSPLLVLLDTLPLLGAIWLMGESASGQSVVNLGLTHMSTVKKW